MGSITTYRLCMRMHYLQMTFKDFRNGIIYVYSICTKWFLLLSKMKDEYLNNGYHVFKVFLDEVVNTFYDNY